MKQERAAALHGEQQASIMILVFMLAIVLPLSTSFWILSLVLSSGTNSETYDPISPGRWLLSFSLPVIVVGWGLRRRSLDYSGAMTSLFIGFVITLSSYCFVASFLFFFFTSSKATRFRAYQKLKYEEEFKEGGQRTWVQVLCNGGVATEMALIYLMERGCGEGAVDFVADYRGSWLAMAVLGAIACASGDTLASELGSVVGTGMPRLITTGERVPRGTNGAVSLAGLFFSACGGLGIGTAYYGALLLCVNTELLTDAPAQWQVLIVGALAGLFGSLVDSLLGATLQYSGIHEKTGKIMEQPAEGVRHISGLRILDNHSVNLISTLATALVTPLIAKTVWQLF